MGKVMPIAAPSVLQGAAKKLQRAERSTLLELYDQYKAMRHETLRRLIIDHDRIDILGSVVLNYQIEPIHLAMLRWQFIHPDNLQLVFRGAGKTTVCTIIKAIHMIIKDRNIRILLSSKTTGQSARFLKEIKAHLEGNELLIEVFGSFYDPNIVAKWDNTEIEVVGRTSVAKESTITTCGVESAVVSGHYDVLISDDLVDENNTRTPHMRAQVRQWYYQVLEPTLEPPDPTRPHVGEHHRQGTRYHYADLYGHFKDGSPDGTGAELKRHTQVIPALSPSGRSPWPEKYPPAWFQAKKLRSGTIIFNAQYQCDTEAMKGEIFKYDQCIQISADEWPDESDFKVFTGVDLAIGEKEKNDLFAIVVIGCVGHVMRGKRSDFQVYVLEYYFGHLRFSEQTDKITEMIDKWNPIATGIESNAYQRSQLQVASDARPMEKLVGINTDKDKVTRAHLFQPMFEQDRMHFKKGLQGPLIDQLVLFPNHQYKDGFDALDMAVQVAKKRGRRLRRETEPGLM